MTKPTRSRLLVLLFLLAAPIAATAQVGPASDVLDDTDDTDDSYDTDDTDKPLPESCSPAPGDGAADEPVPPPELDEPIATDSPELGLSPSPAGRIDEEKTAGESCALEDGGFVAEAYEKTDDAARPLAPCAAPAALTVEAGLRDNYALPQDRANLTPAIMAAANVFDPARWVGFDAPSHNFHFGHAFTPSFINIYGYQSGSLTIRYRPIGEINSNDTLSLWTPGGVGWSTTFSNLGPNQPGQSVVVVLDLRTLRTGASNLLADISTSRGLNVYIQDDTAIDSMTLTLACDQSAAPGPVVGVLRGAAGCGDHPAYDVFLDNEDNRNANARGGWLGATVSDKNTLLRLCGVDGRLFAPTAGANYALVSLSRTCPDGFTRFDRFHDDEDNRTASWDNTPSGSPTITVQPEKNTNMAFCVATGSASVANAAFPDLGVSYGVFGGANPATSPWALARGFVFLDDEDNRNRNAPASGPGYTASFVELGKNTRYAFARIR